MTAPDLRVVGKPPLSDGDPSTSFFLIVADHDRGFFCIEGPMGNDRLWQAAAMHARHHERRILCGPAGPDRDALAINYQQANKLGGVPPGSIVRLRQ